MEERDREEDKVVVKIREVVVVVFLVWAEQNLFSSFLGLQAMWPDRKLDSHSANGIGSRNSIEGI